MSEFRIQKHPIISAKDREKIEFSWQEKILSAFAGETIASALIANGIHIFGHHLKDHSPQGIFCANGQCSQCMVIADGKPVKSCMELVKPGMHVQPSEGVPVLPEVGTNNVFTPIREVSIPVLIIGGGPAGLSAGIELGKCGIKTIIIDDKHRLGGKLVLQTHRFFGSTAAVYAGTRGIDIATLLENDIRQYKDVEIWCKSTALAVFSDHKVGILRDGEEYILVTPQILLTATGAREKFLAFKGNTMPGVYGAGAFQTLVNRDLVRPAKKLFIIGGGNVGLIAGYHALQAGIGVVGLAEALPACGGYKVHKDKLIRMGVPIYTSHTILSANGQENVSSVTIARVNDQFQPIAGTEQSFECDSVLIAVGLAPVNEFYLKAQEYGMKTFSAGDAEEIAEASAAIFSGKIKGLEIAHALGHSTQTIPEKWYQMVSILKSKPGKIFPETQPEEYVGVVPVIHCNQEIPCDPCASVCPNGLISIDERNIRQIPSFLGTNYCCQYCERCVVGCPGLAISLVDYRTNKDFPIISLPYEFNKEAIKQRDQVEVLDTEGNVLGLHEILGMHTIPQNDRTLIVEMQVPKEYARKIAGIRIQDPKITRPLDQYVDHIADDIIVCRCERVTAGEIRALIREGYRDINEIKAVSRAGMGACGSKTCGELISRLFREEGISLDEITDQTRRPLFVEVPLGVLSGTQSQEKSS